MAELATIQKWLTSIIVRPGKLQEKIFLADQHYHLNHTDIVTGSEDLGAVEKIGIYARGYILRLMECMEAEFPALKYLLGDQLFDSFAGAYLSRLPPNSFDLYDLGKKFPDFLEASQPAGLIAESENLSYHLPVELARLERALAEVSRMPGPEGSGRNLQPEALPFFLLTGTDFQTAPCLKLLRQKFNLTGFVKAIQHDKKPDSPAEEDTFVAVSRVNYAVVMYNLENWQWHFLAALESTHQYGPAIDLCAVNCGISKDELLANLLLWLPVAECSGLVFRP